MGEIGQMYVEKNGKKSLPLPFDDTWETVGVEDGTSVGSFALPLLLVPRA